MITLQYVYSDIYEHTQSGQIIICSRGDNVFLSECSMNSSTYKWELSLIRIRAALLLFFDFRVFRKLLKTKF